MGKRQIIKNNKLIAEFMGGNNHPTIVPYIPEQDDIWFDMDNYPEPRDNSLWKIHELKYHSSWNWLMPVVEKIESLNINSIPIEVIIGRTECFISDIEGRTSFEMYDQGSKILSTYEAVVQFIKWYNKNKTT